MKLAFLILLETLGGSEYGPPIWRPAEVSQTQTPGLFAQGSLELDQGPEPKSLWYEPKGLNLESLVESQLIQN